MFLCVRFFVFLTVLFISVQSYAVSMRIAVMDFKADGVPDATARRVSELIRTEMINSGEFTIIERKQMDIILREQGFQKTGCTDETCAVEVGKLVSAEKILIGTVMKLGNKIIINGRIVDVEKGIAEIGEKEEAESIAELSDASASFTRNLTNRLNSNGGLSSGTNYDKTETGDSKEKETKAMRAGLLSLLPFWSGSIGTPNTLAGVTMVGIKLTSLGFGIKYGIDYNNDRSTKNLSIFSLLMGVYVTTTIVDVFFSYFSVEGKYSFFFGQNDPGFIREGNFAFDISPRFNTGYESFTCMQKPDGMDLSITCFY